MLKIEIKKSVKKITPVNGKIIVRNQYYFRIKASNGRILCHSETYNRKAGVLNAIKCIKEGFLSCSGYKVIDTTVKKSRV